MPDRRPEVIVYERPVIGPIAIGAVVMSAECQACDPRWSWSIAVAQLQEFPHYSYLPSLPPSRFIPTVFGVLSSLG